MIEVSIWNRNQTARRPLLAPRVTMETTSFSLCCWCTMRGPSKPKTGGKEIGVMSPGEWWNKQFGTGLRDGWMLAERPWSELSAETMCAGVSEVASRRATEQSNGDRNWRGTKKSQYDQADPQMWRRQLMPKRVSHHSTDGFLPVRPLSGMNMGQLRHGAVVVVQVTPRP